MSYFLHHAFQSKPLVDSLWRNEDLAAENLEALPDVAFCAPIVISDIFGLVGRKRMLDFLIFWSGS